MGAMEVRDYPILEFDPDKAARIEPARAFGQTPGSPRSCVLVFYQNIIDGLLREGLLHELDYIDGDTGRTSLYVLNYELSGGSHADSEPEPVIVVNPGLGAPAAAAILEILIAMGVNRVVACYHGRLLSRSQDQAGIVVPCAAIRQDGVSYQYAPPSREIAANPDVVKTLEEVLRRHKCDYVVGKTWTSDAIYRETDALVALRRQEGALTSDMQTAALLAVAEWRQVPCGQYIGTGDDIGGTGWDHRYCPKRPSNKAKLFWLSVEACCELKG